MDTEEDDDFCGIVL